MTEYRVFYLAGRKAAMLVLVLWALCSLSIFGLYLGYGARQKIIILKRLSERNNLHFIAEAGIKKAIMELSRDDTPVLDSFQERWADSESLFKDVKIGLGSFSICYNYNQKGKTREIFGVADEARKININKAPLSTLKRLFKVVLDMDDLSSQELAASIVDFRDGDSALSIPIGSAEDSYYANLDEPYDCKDADLQLIDELLLVKGITQEVFDKIKNFVTIYSERAVNINTASYKVLLALGIKEKLLDKIMDFRQSGFDAEETADSNIFNSPQSIVAQLSQRYSLSADEVANLSNLASAGLLTTGSDYFMIRAKAKLTYSSSSREIICVVDRDGKILFWREI